MTVGYNLNDVVPAPGVGDNQLHRMPEFTNHIEAGKLCKAFIRARALLRCMARHADRPVLQCTVSAGRSGTAGRNTWSYIRAHIHNMAREVDLWVWSSEDMWGGLKPFRMFRSTISWDHWHSADDEGVGQMAGECQHAFTKIVAVRAHCRLLWQWLRRDNPALETPLAEGDLCASWSAKRRSPCTLRPAQLTSQCRSRRMTRWAFARRIPP